MIESTESLVTYKVVSSAYIAQVEDFTESGRSFMKRENREGPSIDPWGTPASKLEELAVLFSILTSWDLLSVMWWYGRCFHCCYY